MNVPAGFPLDWQSQYPTWQVNTKGIDMLTTDTLRSFVMQDTRTVANALVFGQLLGTEVGDRVLAELANHPHRYAAVVDNLKRRNAWEVAL